jgi:ribosomal protein S18 acetylase RimI-like enzyme
MNNKNPIQIRKATTEDISAILHLYKSAGIESGNPFTEEEARAHFAIFEQYPNYHLFVAILDSNIVGTFALLVMDNLAKRGRRSGVVEDVAVSPDWQGRGIGRAMMEHARKECIQADCYKFSLSSNLQREEAHRFYDALGFERHGYSFRVPLLD